MLKNIQQETAAAEQRREVETMTEPAVVVSPAEWEALRSALDAVGERVDAAWRGAKSN